MVADCLSRQHQLISTEWTLHQDVCNQLWKLWGYPTVDLFATTLNFRLPKLHHSLSGSQCCGDGRIPLQLGRPGVVCLSSLLSGQDGVQLAPVGTKHHAIPDRSFLATKGMVSRPHTGNSGHSPAPSTSQGPTPSAPRAPVPPRSPRASSNRLETVKRLLHHRGYSS